MKPILVGLLFCGISTASFSQSALDDFDYFEEDQPITDSVDELEESHQSLEEALRNYTQSYSAAVNQIVSNTEHLRSEEYRNELVDSMVDTIEPLFINHSLSVNCIYISYLEQTMFFDPEEVEDRQNERLEYVQRYNDLYLELSEYEDPDPVFASFIPLLPFVEGDIVTTCS